MPGGSRGKQDVPEPNIPEDVGDISSIKNSLRDDLHRVITNQRGAIANLQKEKAFYASEVEREEERETMAMTADQVREVDRVQDICDKFNQKIEAEQRKIDELNGRVSSEEYRGERARRTMGGDRALRESQITLQARLRAHENKLEKEMVRLNGALAFNQALRRDIDSMRKERMRFRSIFNKSERQLLDARKKMAELVESATASREARDEASNMMAAMLAEQDRQIKAHARALEEMHNIVEQDRGIIETERQKQLAIADLATNTALGGTKGQLIAKKKTDDAEATGEDPKSLCRDMESVLEHAGIGPGDVQLRANEYLRLLRKYEESNFTLYNKQRDLDREVAELVAQYQCLEEGMEKVEKLGKASADEKARILAESAHQVTLAEEEAKMVTTRAQAATEEMAATRAAVEVLGRMVRAAPPGVDVVAGAVTDTNIMQWMSALETRAVGLHLLLLVLEGHVPTLPPLAPNGTEEEYQTWLSALKKCADPGVVKKRPAVLVGQRVMHRPQDLLNAPAAPNAAPTTLKAEVSLDDHDDGHGAKPLLGQELVSRAREKAEAAKRDRLTSLMSGVPNRG